MRDGARIALEELPASRQIESLECIGEQLEIGIFQRRTEWRWDAGAGHIGSNLTFACPRGGGVNNWAALQGRMPESNQIGTSSPRPCHRNQESVALCYYKSAAYGKCTINVQNGYSITVAAMALD